LSIYSLEDNNYEASSQSKLLPGLDIDLFINCVKMSSKLEAMTAFSQGI
jgi:hypothetical protein